MMERRRTSDTTYMREGGDKRLLWRYERCKMGLPLPHLPNGDRDVS